MMNQCRSKAQHGFTLVELMVASFIGVLVLMIYVVFAAWVAATKRRKYLAMGSKKR